MTAHHIEPKPAWFIATFVENIDSVSEDDCAWAATDLRLRKFLVVLLFSVKDFVPQLSVGVYIIVENEEFVFRDDSEWGGAHPDSINRNIWS